MAATSIKFETHTDQELVLQARSGQVHAFSLLVERNQCLARAIAFSVTNDYTSTEDLAQEAMVTAWLKLGDLEDPARFRPWLARIVRNTAHYWRRHQGRHAPAAQHGIDALENIADTGESPLDRALHSEEWAHTEDALSRLPARYREPLILYYCMEQSHTDVASALGVNEAVVRQRLCRARKKLKQGVGSAERTGLRLRNQVSVAATVLVMIQARQAWATNATRMGTQPVLSGSPKVFVALGAVAGSAMVACVAAMVFLLNQGGTSEQQEQATASPIAADVDEEPQASTLASPSTHALFATESPQGLVQMGRGKVKDNDESGGSSADSANSSASMVRQEKAKHLGTTSGRIKKHGPARLAPPEGEEKELLRPSIDMGAVKREMWQ